MERQKLETTKNVTTKLTKRTYFWTQMNPVRPLAWVICMLKTIHVKKCCVEVFYILSNGAGEELETQRKEE